MHPHAAPIEQRFRATHPNETLPRGIRFHQIGPLLQPSETALYCAMTAGDENVAKPRPVGPSTLRVRRHRERRRECLHLLTLEMPETAIDAAIARGLPQARGNHPSMVSDQRRLCH